jgi:hypothetical protein
VLGQTLTSSIGKGGGSFAAAKVHNEVREDKRRADVRMISGTGQRLVDALWELNGFPGEPPEFCMQDDVGLEQERADRDAVLVDLGVRFTPEYVAQPSIGYQQGGFGQGTYGGTTIVLSDLLAATAYVLPALEVVGSRIADWNISILDTIADNASAGLYVLGQRPVKLGELDLRLAGMVMERRGEPVSFGVGAACLGHPLNAALWLARTLVEAGTPLRAGDVVLSGALGPMVSVAPGDVFEARIQGLGSVRACFDSAS